MSACTFPRMLNVCLRNLVLRLCKKISAFSMAGNLQKVETNIQPLSQRTVHRRSFSQYVLA
jgi:hypothetical protein